MSYINNCTMILQIATNSPYQHMHCPIKASIIIIIIIIIIIMIGGQLCKVICMTFSSIACRIAHPAWIEPLLPVVHGEFCTLLHCMSTIRTIP